MNFIYIYIYIYIYTKMQGTTIEIKYTHFMQNRFFYPRKSCRKEVITKTAAES